MSRKEFLKSLRKHLAFLDKETLESEILIYINKIDGSKKEDKEVIASFGSMEDIVKDVCKKHNIDYKQVKKENETWFKRFYNELIDLSTILKNSNGKKRVQILLDVLLLIVVTCILKIPFIFIRDLGDNLVNTIFNNNINILTIWGLVIEIVYIIIALSFFIKTFEKWFKGLKKEN